MFHQGLWGGEGVIKGMLKREDKNHRNFKPPPAKYWWPTLFEGVVYSEILDKHIEMVCTKRGIRLVDEVAGFDKYLLTTPVNEVYAQGLLRIKRELLLALADKESFTTKAGGKSAVYDKYQQWAVGSEEADWHGLTLEEAKKKQGRIETEQAERETVPDKMRYRKELVEMLRSGKMDELDMELSEENELEGKGGLQGMLGGITKVFKK
jgi:large subunit ribosomal protein L28